VTETLTIRRPDDWHVHLRDGELLAAVGPDTARHFARALVMPNLTPPVVTGADASAYRERVLQATAGSDFEPLMTIKVLPQTTAEVVREAKQAGVVAGKLYPQGVTTNSEDGWSEIEALYPAFEAMQEEGLVLCLHGETPGVFSLDRESHFVQETLGELSRSFPRLKIVLEHVTTRVGVEAVQRLGNVAGTITVHHLLLTLDDVIGGALNPHHFCKPVAKRPEDREALVEAALRSPKFFLGTDSAPHLRERKECAAGCAGVYTAPVAVALSAEVFDAHGALEHLEAFTSERGAATLTLSRQATPVPADVGGVVPMRAGAQVAWSVA
jgi:dihydroorotase